MSNSRKQTIRDYLDAYNRADWPALATYVGPAYVHRNNDAALDLAQFTRGAQWFRAGLPDFRIDAAAMVAEGDLVAVRWEARGTHRHSLMGEVPTDREVTLYGLTLYRFDDDLIVEDWEAMDEDHLWQQVGRPATDG